MRKWPSIHRTHFERYDLSCCCFSVPYLCTLGSAGMYLDKCLPHVDRIACVTVSYYPVTWAATRRLQRIYLYFWTADAVYASSLSRLKTCSVHVSEPVWSSGKALGCKRKDLGSIPLRLSFLFKEVVVCGHCLVTLSITSY